MNLKTALVSALLLAAPATATTVLNFNFGGATSNANSFTYSQGSLTLTATARRFTAQPGLLALLSQTTATGQVRRTLPGLGVAGGASADQIDTNSVGTAQAPGREALLLSGNQDFSLRGLKLSFVDNDDTLKVYGVRSTGVLVDLGYGNTSTVAGTIRGGLNGAAIGLTYSSGVNSGTATFGLAPTTYFSRYLFTTRVGGEINFLGTLGQGYRLDALTAGVPEPATWGMLLVGFGLIGVAARRRSSAVAA